MTHLQIRFLLHLIARIHTYPTLNEGQIKLHIQARLLLRDFILRDFVLTRLEYLHHFSKLRDYVRFNVDLTHTIHDNFRFNAMWPYTSHDRSSFIGG